MTNAQRINELIREFGIQATIAMDTREGGIEIDWNGIEEKFETYEDAEREVRLIAETN